MLKKKNDIILIIVIIAICAIAILAFKLSERSNNIIAYVYYKDELVETINLSQLTDEIVVYKINGENGEMIIEAKHNAIRVESENSPHHYCSIQGFSNSTHEPIICLPNKVYIKLVGDKSKVDIEI